MGRRPHSSNLQYRIEIKIRVRRVLANAQRLVIGEMIGWHRQIVRGRHAGKYAPGKIVFRAVAGTEESSRTLGGRIVRIGIGKEFRDAAKMRADADEDQVFGFQGPAPVGGVIGLLGLPRVWIGEAREKSCVAQSVERRLGRLTMKTGLALHSVTICCPGCIWLMSISAWPPAATVAASGFIWAMNGHAVAPTPTTPVAAVKMVRKSRRVGACCGAVSVADVTLVIALRLSAGRAISELHQELGAGPTSPLDFLDFPFSPTMVPQIPLAAAPLALFS
jgi:hypothetical protein